MGQGMAIQRIHENREPEDTGNEEEETESEEGGVRGQVMHKDEEIKGIFMIYRAKEQKRRYKKTKGKENKKRPGTRQAEGS